MNATDELRKLLDERGVEWENRDGFNDWKTKWERGRTRSLYTENKHSGFTVLEAYTLTPEQAIAATLGRGECKLRDCEGSFSAVNRPVWLCDCGAFVTQYTDATTYHKPRFCPNCGRSVKR